MTTIIATKNAMVGDLQTSRGTFKSRTIPKVMKVNGELIGMAGNLDEILAARLWFLNGKQGEFPRGESLSGVLVNSDGIFEFFGNGVLLKYPEKYLAIGSGGEVAMGAMDAGADIHEAMKIALKRDAGTGFGVTYLELD